MMHVLQIYNLSWSVIGCPIACFRQPEAFAQRLQVVGMLPRTPHEVH